jgi:succinate dehydrogenase/fumarate reductase-like Fe-S protein
MPITPSATRYAAIQLHSTRSSTKNGSSHSVYCGECTLCSSRNPHSIAPDTAIHGYSPSRW